MSDFRKKVVIGNLVIFPHLMREFLKKSYYILTYEPENEKIVLCVNHISGAKTLFEVRNASYESAVKLAEEFGLKSDGDFPLSWNKWNPVLCLHHDNSEDAESLRREMLILGVPFYMVPDSSLGLSDGRGLFQAPSWTAGQMLGIIKEIAERYKDQLSTTP